MDQMVDVTIEGDWFASLRVRIVTDDWQPGTNAFVAEAQALLAADGYVLDNEVTYAVRDPETGEQTRYAPDA